MLSYATATEAERPDLYRERLDAERDAQRQHVRLEILRMIVGANMGVAMTPAELVAAAETVEAFVVGSAEVADHHRDELVSAVLHAERAGVFRDGLVNSLAAVRAARTGQFDGLTATEIEVAAARLASAQAPAQAG